jgi:hypothetical protein
MKTAFCTLHHCKSSIRAQRLLAPKTAGFAVGARMKRGISSTSFPKSKKSRIEIPDYHLSPQRRDESGAVIWPAPVSELRAAGDFILEWFNYVLSYFSSKCRA